MASIEVITLSQLIRGFIPNVDLSTEAKAIIAIEACIFLIESKAIPESAETRGFMEWVVGFWRKEGPGRPADEPTRVTYSQKGTPTLHQGESRYWDEPGPDLLQNMEKPQKLH